MTRRGITLVYGGASVGLMGTVADAQLAAGGQVIGIIPRSLVDRELAHTGLTELQVVDDLLVRKQIMMDKSDAFVCLPGGIGTLDEFFEVLTWRALACHQKPIGLIDTGGFYQPLLAVLDHMVDQGFFGREARELIHVADSPAALLDLLAT